jgi:hypothetical protein
LEPERAIEPEGADCSHMGVSRIRERTDSTAGAAGVSDGSVHPDGDYGARDVNDGSSRSTGRPHATPAPLRRSQPRHDRVRRAAQRPHRRQRRRQRRRVRPQAALCRRCSSCHAADRSEHSPNQGCGRVRTVSDRVRQSPRNHRATRRAPRAQSIRVAAACAHRKRNYPTEGPWRRFRPKASVGDAVRLGVGAVCGTGARLVDRWGN